MKTKKTARLQVKEEILSVPDSSKLLLTLETALILITDKCRTFKATPTTVEGSSEFEKLIVSLAVLSFEKDYEFQGKIYYWSMKEPLKIFDKVKKESSLLTQEKKFWF